MQLGGSVAALVLRSSLFRRSEDAGPPPPPTYVNLLNRPVGVDFFAEAKSAGRELRPLWLTLLLTFLGPRFRLPALRLCLAVVPHLTYDYLGTRYVPLAFLSIIFLDSLLWTLF